MGTMRNCSLLLYSVCRKSASRNTICLLPNLLRKDEIPASISLALFQQQRNYAARKGTRAKREKKKQKKEIVVEEFIPYKLKQELINKPKRSRRVNEEGKSEPMDDVYLMSCYKTRIFGVSEAIMAHREVHDPSMYNKPNANLIATIELDLSTEKKTRFLSISRVVELPFPYQIDDTKTVLAFAKSAEIQNQAIEAGATKVGGPELVKSIQTGDVRTAEFKYVVAHDNMAEEIVPLRGLLKTKFPATRLGSIGPDIGALVRKYINGIEYESKSDVHEKDFGWIDVNIGPLSSPIEHLEGNLAAIIKDINSVKGRRSADVVTRCLLWTGSSKEKFVVNHQSYVEDAPVSKKKITPIEEEIEEKISAVV
ncbi:large ribosomal subunit protein uL1m-like [Artemia franciscana]|uniref:large ribosomal subunit protein uL1m-like n=1 Tax=Artemia franciscana TaxID=6661 RepID=UPI0032DB1025